MTTEELIAKANTLGSEASKQTGVSFNPLISNLLSASAIGTKPITVPPTQLSTDVQSSIASSKALQDAFVSQAEKDLQAQRDTYLNDLKTATEGYANYGTRQKELESQQNISGISNELKQINLQIADEMGNLGISKANVQGKNIPQEFIDVQTADVERRASAKISALQARQQALSGNLSLAEKLVNRSLDLEFKPIEQKISAIKSFLDINQDKMTTEQKKRADSLKTYLDSQDALIQEKKSELSNVMTLANRYPSARISPSDSYETAQAKVLKSAEYLNERTREQQLIKESGGVQNAKAVAQQAESALLNSRAGGQFADGNVYAEQKRKYIMAGGSANNFDSAFSYLLSDDDKKKFAKSSTNSNLDFNNL